MFKVRPWPAGRILYSLGSCMPDAVVGASALSRRDMIVEHSLLSTGIECVPN